MAYCGETTIDTKKPDLKQLSCAAGGKLLYDGKEAELRYVMPWYQDMWPDSVSEWGFTIFTDGTVGALAGSGGGGEGNGGGDSEIAPTTTTPTSSGVRSSGKSSGGGGGGGDDGGGGGGIEEP